MKEKGSKERPGLGEILNRKLDISPDILPGECMMEVRGRNSMTIRGCGKILLYTPVQIRLGLRGGALSVCGRRLVCTSYCPGAVIIDGCFDSITFEEEKELT